MRKELSMALCLCVLLMLVAVNVFAAHGEKSPKKQAILLAAFGTTVPEARRALDGVAARVKDAFPDTEIRWGYTSSIVRKKLAKEGVMFDSPETALSKLMDEGFTHVAVLSLHTIPGEEFHNLFANARLFGQMTGGFEKVLVAWPLLSSREDMQRAAKAMIQHIPAARKKDEAVLLMGHGSAKHPSDAVYSAMNQALQELDSNVYLATVEGYPALDDILPKLEQKKIKKVYLMPFMAVAGDHALNDMAGDDPESWKSVLGKKGLACEAILKGAAEYREIVDIWIDHLKIVLAHME